MDIAKQLEKEHSRINTDYIANSIGSSPEKFQEVINIIYSSAPPLPQRASWLLATINKKHPKFLEPYIGKFIETVQDFKIDAVKRNMLLVLSEHSIPEKMQGKLINTCYDFILSTEEPVAIKVHAMQIIANISKKYPEIKQELKQVIENELPKNSQAFSARARHILKDINTVR